MSAITFVLKRVSRATACHAGPSITGPSLFDPTWALRWGETNDTHLRFKGVRGRTEWMEVFCDDDRCSELHEKHVVWKVQSNCSSIQRYWATAPNRPYKAGRGQPMRKPRPCATAYLVTGEDIIIVRPCMFRVLRAVVMFRCLLARVRAKRLARIKTFIRGTHWAHKECTLSRFSGTINTPVKQRICAYI